MNIMVSVPLRRISSTPNSTILAKKMQRRRPQKDDVPLTNLYKLRKNSRAKITSFSHFPEIVFQALIELGRVSGTTVDAIEQYINKRYEIFFPFNQEHIKIILDWAQRIGLVTRARDAKYKFPFNSKPLPNSTYYMIQRINKKPKKRRGKKPNKPPANESKSRLKTWRSNNC